MMQTDGQEGGHLNRRCAETKKPTQTERERKKEREREREREQASERGRGGERERQTGTEENLLKRPCALILEQFPYDICAHHVPAPLLLPQELWPTGTFSAVPRVWQLFYRLDFQTLGMPAAATVVAENEPSAVVTQFTFPPTLVHSLGTWCFRGLGLS